MSGERWIPIVKTTPSGKRLFVCRCCGRVSVAPDKACNTYEDPNETWKCSEWVPEWVDRVVLP